MRAQLQMRPVALGTRRDFAGFPAALFQPIDPGAAHGVLLRDGRGRHPGIAVAENTFAKIHRIGAHAAPPALSQKYHEAPIEY